MRNLVFKNNEYYHIYNRGTDKRDIFLDNFDYVRFLKSLKEFNQEDPVISLYISDQLKKRDVVAGPLQNEKLVEIVAYCLNPNHYHLILKQSREGGISEFIKRVSGGYTRYFNHRHKRSGVLFQSKFKAIHIDSNEYLLHLSAYVNGNNIIHKNEIFRSSLKNYLENRTDDLCNPGIVLEQFRDKGDYEKFVETNVEEIAQRRSDLKKYLLEE